MNIDDTIPTLTYPFLDYFSNYNLEDKILLEIGSGNSTLFWENKFKKVISYENDISYFNHISSKIKNDSTELLFYDLGIFEDKKFIQNIKIADYIIIDNNPLFIPRGSFSIFSHKNMKKDATIILDNGTWNLDAYNYLIKHFFVKDFPGLNNYNQLTVTSIFSPQKTDDYFLGR